MKLRDIVLGGALIMSALTSCVSRDDNHYINENGKRYLIQTDKYGVERRFEMKKRENGEYYIDLCPGIIEN